MGFPWETVKAAGELNAEAPRDFHWFVQVRGNELK